MGRQIAVALTQVDEKAFLEFLRSKASIKLFESFAPSIEQLWVDSFAPELTDHWSYYIWNQEFLWKPSYNRVSSNTYYKEHIGWYYIANSGDAPVIEFCRSNVIQARYGRLYWSKYFSAPNGLDYDVSRFSKWYDLVVRWIRKNAAGKMKDGWVTWFLPDAWRLHVEQSIKLKDGIIT